MTPLGNSAGSLVLSDVVASYEGAEVVHGVSFSVEPAEFVTLLGPSGCGKSTTLRCVAGLHHIDSGVIAIGGKVVAAAGQHTRPEHRNINMVFQSYAIWPHMSVFDNVAYGLRIQKRAPKVIDQRVREMLALVGLGEMAARQATGLSGGQQQRVALARALATEPRVLLLDEPLSNLDSALRSRMRTEILRIQRETGTTTLYVTHDRSEALSMSDKIVVLDKGSVKQIGSPRDLYTCPVDTFIAGFLGPANFVRAHVVAVNQSHIEVVAPDLEGNPRFKISRPAAPAAECGEWIDLIFRPEHLRVRSRDESRENTFAADLLRQDFMGGRSEVTLRSGALTLSCEVDSKRLVDLSDSPILVSIASDDIKWVRRQA